jgi:hypothetical protein
LLEADEVQRLREHLAACPACRTALAEAEAHQGLLARAAHVAQAVPPFVAPSDQPEQETRIRTAPVPSESVVASPVSLPLALPTVTRNRRRWPWLATAAALLLLVGGVVASLYRSYDSGLTQHLGDLAKARAEVEAIDGQFASTAHTYERAVAKLPEQLRTRKARLQVTGAARYQADAPSQVRVVTQDGEGSLTTAQLHVSLQDATGKRQLFSDDFHSPGDLAISLPPGMPVKPGEVVQLVCKADTGRGGTAELREGLEAAAPSYLTHIALNKRRYQVGDTVLFRTLTLHRFSLKPADREVALTCTVRDARRLSVKQVQVRTATNGVATGEFLLDGNFAGAEYTVEVTGAQAGKDGAVNVLSQARHFTVVRNQEPGFAGAGPRGLDLASPQWQFDRERYQPGDKVRVQAEFFKRQGNNQKAVANQPVVVKAAEGDGKPIQVNGAPAGQPLQTTTDAKGRALFEVHLNRNLAAGKPTVEVELPDGASNARFRQTIPMAGPQSDLQFFPEGGDLVAGVLNRLYYRDNTGQRECAPLLGRVVDREGKEVIRLEKGDTDLQRDLGSGYLTFTPKAGQDYTFKLDGADAAVALPPVQKGGVALSVPEAVGKEGNPIRAIVRCPEPSRQLLIVAACRGQVVDQQFIASSPAGVEVRFRPVPGTRGVVRLTVYEVRDERLLPRAERLAYQIPAQQLMLSVADARDGTLSYRSGERVNLELKASDEKGKAAATTYLAAVVDERALSQGKTAELSPPAFFYLASEVSGGEGLEDADFLVSDTPQAREALDRFLATEGWRRFTEQAGDAVAARTPERLLVFRRDNFAAVTTDFEQALVSGRDELRRKALQERQALQERRDEQSAAMTAAVAALRDFQELPWTYVRTAVGGLILLFLGAGGLLLMIGFARAIRGRRPTVAFASAFAALLLCLATYGLTADLRTSSHQHFAEELRAQAADPRLPELPEQVGRTKEKRRNGGEGRPAPAGRFAEAGETGRSPALNASRDESRTELADGLAKGAGTTRAMSGGSRGGAEQAAATKYAMPAARATPHAALAKPTSGGAPQKPITSLAPAAPPASAPQVAPGNPSALGKTAVPMPAPAENKADRGIYSLGEDLRQFTYANARSSGGLPQTLVWYPALAAPDGTARLAFDLPAQAATYRVLLYAHSTSGRLGAFQGKLETRK